MSVTRQLIYPIDFHIILFLLWKSVGYIDCLVTMFSRKKIHFEVNYSFNIAYLT